VQRDLYDGALEERKEAYQRSGKTITRFDQFRELTPAMVELPRLARFGLQVARGTLTRLDRAMVAFFRRLTAGQRPGYPRFHGRNRFTSVSWSEPVSWRVLPGSGRHGRLRMTGVGM